MPCGRGRGTQTPPGGEVPSQVPPQGGTRTPPPGGTWSGTPPPGGYPDTPPGGYPVRYHPPRGGTRTPPGGTRSGTPLGGYPDPPGGVPSQVPPPGGGTQVGQQKEYSLHGGRYASCVHAGGLSCCNIISHFGEYFTFSNREIFRHMGNNKMCSKTKHLSKVNLLWIKLSDKVLSCKN